MATLNLRMTRGNTFVFLATVKQNGAAVNITGATFKLTAKYSYADPDLSAVFQVTSASGGIVILSPTAGTLQVTVASTATSSVPLKPTDLVYDVQMTTSGGTKYSILSGVITVNPNVTLS